MNLKIDNSNKQNTNHDSKVFQYYSTNIQKHIAYNELVGEDFFKIEISLSGLLSRKNMAFNQLLNRINKYFLLEFLCVILQEQGLWDKKFCNNGSVCNIQKVISTLNIYPISKCNKSIGKEFKKNKNS